MKTDVQDDFTHSTTTRRARPPRPTMPHAHPGTDAQPTAKASAAAMDEVFANLARNVEMMQESRDRVCGETATKPPANPSHTSVGTVPRPPRSSEWQPIDPASLRTLDAEMDRQHERLAELLRDIEGITATR